MPTIVVGAPTGESDRLVGRWLVQFLETENTGTRWTVADAVERAAA